MIDGRLHRAESILRASCGERVRAGYPMAPLTTFRIGGPAALFLEPESEGDLRAAGSALTETGVPFVVVGKGSNILVSDSGFPGLVLRLGRAFRWAARDGERLTAGGAMPLPALAGIALRHGLARLEFGVAIPASLGGAVKMNAGAHGRELAEVVAGVEVFRLLEVKSSRLSAGEVGFSYRTSELPRDAVVTGAGLDLEAGDPVEIRARMDAAREWRRATQPLAEPNCGSVFKNPADHHAAKLIDEAGGKGLRVGGAEVSSKHANFIVAATGAKASDVVELIRELQAIVEDRTGVRLEPEVRLVGEFDRVPR